MFIIDKNNERETLIRKYKQLQALEERKQTSNKLYKIGFYFLCGMALMGGFWVAYSVGYELGKSKNKYKRY